MIDSVPLEELSQQIPIEKRQKIIDEKIKRQFEPKPEQEKEKSDEEDLPEVINTPINKNNKQRKNSLLDSVRRWTHWVS